MRLLQQGGRALADEARLLLAALRDRRLALALGIFAALLLLAAQAPLNYSLAVGQEDGPGSDLPLLAGFYPPEHDIHGLFRWTSERAVIQLPGVGQRSLQVTLKTFPISKEVALRGPREIELWDGGRLIERLPVRPDGAIYRFILPPPPATTGDHAIELRSATFVPTGDQRAIGTPVDAVRVVGVGWPVLPAWRSTLAWLGAAALAWLALRRAGFGPPAALALLLPALLLAGLAALVDPPRFAFGAGPALIALALGWVLVLLLNAAAPALSLAGAALAGVAGGLWVLGDAGPAALQIAAALLLAGWLREPIAALYRRFGPPIAPAAWRWLLLFALLVFTMRYGGKIYPEAMPGDIGFHANRYNDVVRGRVLLLSKNRGVDFPYPPAFYLLLAPFSLLGAAQRVLLQLGGALLDALSPFLVYTIAARIGGGAAERRNNRTALALPLVAAAIYSLSAAGFMTTWWNFSTHIFTQFAHLLLITALVLLWRVTDQQPTTNDQRPSLAGDLSSLVGLIVLQSLVYLGHFGFWINMSLLCGIGLAALAVATLRGLVSWRRFRLALLGFVAAELFAALFFYSAYAGLFLEQIQATANGGLTGLAGRAPVDRGVLWRTLWDAGLRMHFGFFPLPLALGGLLLLARRPRIRGLSNPDPSIPFDSAQGRRQDSEGSGRDEGDDRRTSRRSRLAALLVLMTGTFAIGLVFALLPFLSGSTLSTRWLMFSAWAVAVGTAAGAQALWSSGRAGRLLVIVMAGYMFWITASMWLMALAWRVRPPEPF